MPESATARKSGWRRRGTELSVRTEETLQRAKLLVGPDLEIGEMDIAHPGRVTELISTLTWLFIERVREPTTSSTVRAELCELVTEMQDLTLELHEHHMTSRVRRIAACESGLGRLRALPTSADLFDRVCGELARSCGFSRVMLSRVEDQVWSPWVSYTDAPDPVGWMGVWLQASIPLDEMILESRLLVERRPALVHDVSRPEVHSIVHSSRSSSYVVAPIMPAGDVVGFIHADHSPSDRRCDEEDRDVLWAFSEGFGRIYERTMLVERLRTQRDEVLEALGAVEGAMADLCEAQIDLATRRESGSVVARTAVSVLTTMSTSMESLTPREMEVLNLIVTGANNAAIAEQLVIAEGTVKSHVKHILRKLGAVNRSQVIAHYLGASQDDETRMSPTGPR